MSYLRIISLQLPEIIFRKTYIIKHLAGDFLAHGVTFGDFMARNVLAREFLTRILHMVLKDLAHQQMFS